MRAWLLLAAATVACVPDARPLGSAAPRCGLDLATDECQVCGDAQCCTEAEACANEPGCTKLATCLSSCRSDAACRTDCTVKNQSGETAAASQLAACLARSCEVACELTCGAVAGMASVEESGTCQSCISDNFCQEAWECAGDAACQAYVACRRNCTSGDCIGACQAAHAKVDYCYAECRGEDDYCVRPCSTDYDEVVTHYRGLFDSLQDPKCAEECGARRDWSCVEEQSVPTIRGPVRRLTLAFALKSSQLLPDGILVELCDNMDEVWDEEVTDENGLVTLVDRTDTNGAKLGLNGYLRLTSEKLYPTRVYWGFRLSEESGALGVPIPVFQPQDVASLATDGRGVIAALAVDCAGTQADGVQFTLIGKGDETGGNVSAVYLTNDVPDFTRMATNEEGTAVFSNVPPGTYTVRATPLEVGVGVGEVTVQVLANTLTEVSVAPNRLDR